MRRNWKEAAPYLCIAVFGLAIFCGFWYTVLTDPVMQGKSEPANCKVIRQLKEQKDNPKNWVDAPEAIKEDYDLYLMETHFPCTEWETRTNAS